jgi:hypothetical protein
VRLYVTPAGSVLLLREVEWRRREGKSGGMKNERGRGEEREREKER